MTPQRRWHFSIRVLAPAVAALLVTAAAVFAFVLWSTQDIDRHADAHETALAAGAVQKTIESVPHNQQSVTIWDDAIQNAKFEVNKDWLDNNLGVWMNTFYGYDQTFVLNEHDLPVYGMSNGASPAAWAQGAASRAAASGNADAMRCHRTLRTVLLIVMLPPVPRGC